MKKYEAYNETSRVQFVNESDAIAFAAENGMQVREVDEPVPTTKIQKTAADYKAFADKFFLVVSQDCIDAGNTIAMNDELEVHFAEINKALFKARLDKVHELLLQSELLLPFYTQERKNNYVAMLKEFLTT